MGECKTAMTPTTDKAKKIFGLFPKKEKKGTESSAKSLADRIIEAQESLDAIVLVKSAEVTANGSSEDKKKLAMLELMQHHMDKLVEVGAEYSEKFGK